MKISVIESIVRGNVIDKTEDGFVNRFSESDIISAVNVVKSEMFGIRPEAFSISSIAVEPPSDVSSSRNAVVFSREDTVINLDQLNDAFASLDTGKISLAFRADAPGALFKIGDNAGNHISATIEASSIDVEFSDDDGATVATVSLTGEWDDDRWYTLEIEADGLSATASIGNDSSEEDYTGDLIPATDGAYFGFTNIDSDTYFEGSMGAIGFYNSSDVALALYALDEGSGSDLVDSVGANNGHIFGASVEWLTDDDLPIAKWAERRFCYGVGAFLLRQSGKDSFYRKAAMELEKLYTGN